MSDVPTPPIAGDMRRGVKAIAEFTGESERRAYYLLEKGDLPAFKLRGVWHMRQSAYVAMVERLEAEAMEGPTDATTA